MNNYEYLMNKSEECIAKAIDFKKKGEEDLSRFMQNAGVGYKSKAYELLIEEVQCS